VGEQNVRVHANNKKFTLTAETELLVTCEGAYIRIAGGNVDIHAPGQVIFQGADYDFSGPTRMDADIKQFPDSEIEFDDNFKVSE
jgi:type VI secretion system secreted protein VgrG